MGLVRDLTPYVVTALLSGSLWGAVASLRSSKALARRADAEGTKAEAEAEHIEHESPVKIGAISVQGADAAVLTMERALAATERRAEQAEAGKRRAEERVEELELERAEDRRIIESLREELAELRQHASGIEERLDRLARQHDQRDTQQP